MLFRCVLFRLTTVGLRRVNKMLDRKVSPIAEAQGGLNGLALAFIALGISLGVRREVLADLLVARK